jgi:hypothetical protein
MVAHKTDLHAHKSWIMSDTNQSSESNSDSSSTSIFWKEPSGCPPSCKEAECLLCTKLPIQPATRMYALDKSDDSKTQAKHTSGYSTPPDSHFITAYLSRAHLYNLRTRDTEILIGANTIIDLWTTQCHRCPNALINFRRVRQEVSHSLNIRFVALCLDSNPSDIRFFFDIQDKAIDYLYAEPDDSILIRHDLNLSQVPHYVAIDVNGQVKYSGKEVLAAVNAFCDNRVFTLDEDF